MAQFYNAANLTAAMLIAVVTLTKSLCGVVTIPSLHLNAPIITGKPDITTPSVGEASFAG